MLHIRRHPRKKQRKNGAVAEHNDRFKSISIRYPTVPGNWIRICFLFRAGNSKLASERDKFQHGVGTIEMYNEHKGYHGLK